MTDWLDKPTGPGWWNCCDKDGKVYAIRLYIGPSGELWTDGGLATYPAADLPYLWNGPISDPPTDEVSLARLEKKGRLIGERLVRDGRLTPPEPPDKEG